MTLVIDAHQHFWQRGRDPFDYDWLERAGNESICRDFLPADLHPQLQQAGIDRTVLVQTQHHLEENRWALGLAEQWDFIAGVVGWVDLASADCEDQLLRFLDHPRFVGIRHVTQDEPDEDFIVRDEIITGLRVLEKHQCPFDLLFYVQHLRHAVALGRLLPDLPMVIDPLAKPRIREQQTGDWARQLQEAAAMPNIFCKLSGMITEADWDNWKPADLKPYVETAIEAFGPDRCMFGSDWPVCELAGSYQQVHDALRDVLGPISGDEQGKLFGGTAARFYGLSLDPA